MAPVLPASKQKAQDAPRMLQRAKSSLGSQLTLWRNHPHLLLIPALVLAACVVGGVLGTHYAIQSAVNNARQTATWSATVQAETIQKDIQKAAVPLYQLTRAINLDPTTAMVLVAWSKYAPAFYEAAPNGTRSITISIQGTLAAMYPPDSPDLEYFPIGFDILARNSPFRGLGLLTIARQNLTVQGPLSLMDSDRLLFISPVFIANVSRTRSFGVSMPPIDCPPDLCYINATRSKFWGAVMMAVSVDTLITDSTSLNNLRDQGYNAQLWKGPDPAFNTTTYTPVGTRGIVQDQPEGAVCVEVAILNQQWQLCLWKDEWVSENLNFLYAVVVVGSVIISALLYAVLLSRVEHRAMLHSVLPKAAIDSMRTEMDWKNALYKEEDFETINMETPAQHMLGIISAVLGGKAPGVPTLLAVRDALHRSADVYRPTAEAMKLRMQANAVDDEVRTALVNQLMGRERAVSSDDGRTDIMHTTADIDVLEAPAKDFCTEAIHSTDEVVLDMTGSPTKAGSHKGSASGPLPTLAIAHNAPARATPTFIRALPSQASDSTATASGQLIQGPMGSHGSGSEAGLAITAKRWTGPPVRQVIVRLVRDERGDFQHGEEEGGHETLEGALRNGRLRPSFRMSRLGSGAMQQERPSHGLLTEVEVVLMSADEWCFDAYALETATNGHPLSTLAYWLLHRADLMQWAGMDSDKLVRFLQHVEGCYSTGNPYHNSRHAADVLQSLHVIITRGGLMPGYVDQTTMLAAYLAAIVHDYEHRGRNNDFLINTHDDLAVRYNDRSPMENHHLAAAFALLKQSEHNCLGGLSKSAWSKIRALIIDLVLATDMKQHFAILGQFQTMHALDAQAGAEGIAERSMTGRSSTTASVSLTPVSDTDRLLSLQLALKCADLGHLAASRDIHLKWVAALEEEFFRQGDAERAAGMPISPLCDRSKAGVLKSQVGFFDFVVMPLFKAFAARFNRSTPMLQAVMANYTYWVERQGVSSTANTVSEARPST